MTLARKQQAAIDLDPEEQGNVRVALRHIHAQFGDWTLVAKVLRYAKTTIKDMTYGDTPVSASMAFRVARLLGASIDELLSGKFVPPSTCPYCKQPIRDKAA